MWACLSPPVLQLQSVMFTGQMFGSPCLSTVMLRNGLSFAAWIHMLCMYVHMCMRMYKDLQHVVCIDTRSRGSGCSALRVTITVFYSYILSSSQIFFHTNTQDCMQQQQARTHKWTATPSATVRPACSSCLRHYHDAIQPVQCCPGEGPSALLFLGLSRSLVSS